MYEAPTKDAPRDHMMYNLIYFLPIDQSAISHLLSLGEQLDCTDCIVLYERYSKPRLHTQAGTRRRPSQTPILIISPSFIPRVSNLSTSCARVRRDGFVI